MGGEKGLAKLNVFFAFAYLDVVFAYFLLVPKRLELPDVNEGRAEVPQGRVKGRNPRG